MNYQVSLFSFAACLLFFLPSLATADPCGMVPPIYTGPGAPIVRVGLQQTYVFHRKGVETFVIRPGFQGKVDNFGMLIPFPNPPAIRKVPDNIFDQIANAIDPPEVVVDLRPVGGFGGGGAFGGGGNGGGVGGGGGGGLILRNEIMVITREAVGMYEVAVLRAGGADALKGWMDQHKFQYPEGMDRVVEDYTKQRWCFVAVKTRVGDKAGVDPRPGQREVDGNMPADNGFEGRVQAMGFRFLSPKPVLPMRLSAFNKGELRNVVYMLSRDPRMIRNIPEEYVVRQINGEQLGKNLSDPLPVRVIGDGKPTGRVLKRYAYLRDPTPHNRVAGDMFLADIQAALTRELLSTVEQEEKDLLNVGERLGLRGQEYDNLVNLTVDKTKEEYDWRALRTLRPMTLSVIDGDFPREVIARENLGFAIHNMLPQRNRREIYDAKVNGEPEQQEGYRLSQIDIDRIMNDDSRNPEMLASSTSPKPIPFRNFWLSIVTVVVAGCLCIRIRTVA